MINVVIYPKCSTCRDAVKWFDTHNIMIRTRDIVNEKLSASEIKDIHLKSGLPIKKLFNTSGMKYRELGLKDKINHLSDAALYELLASDGMLVKRPFVYDQAGRLTLGFKASDYEKVWK